MATLEELRQKKSVNLATKPENYRTLSKTELTQIMPNKKEEETEGPEQLLATELSNVNNDLNGRLESFEQQKEDIVQHAEEKVDDQIFDLPVEDIDMGIVKPDEAEKMFADIYANASQTIEEDPNIKAGIEAVSNVGQSKTIHPENMELDDLLKDLDDDDDFEEDDDTIHEFSDDDDDDNNEDEEKQQQMINSMKEQIEEKIKPFSNVFDLKSFKISTKSKSVKKVLEESTSAPTSTWVLLESGVPFTCSALGAVEIEHLDPNKTSIQNGRIDALKRMYGTLFRHYESPNKPKTLEEWLKTIAYVDQDNLIFNYYKATFGLSNLMNYACDKCSEVKIKEVPINDCIKYKDEETKKRVQDILNYGDPSYTGEIKATLIQVSDRYAISIKNPSIYNIVFEFGILDSEFTNKYADVLGSVGYIENIYEIDANKGELIPIKVKEDPTNITKSVKRRIRTTLEILKTLTPDQYNILITEIAKLANDSDKIKYCQPAYTCEKCGTKIEESEMTAQAMLFIRHQLVLIKSL